MSFDTIFILSFIALILVFISFHLTITLIQQHQSKLILKKLHSEILLHSTVKFSQTHDNFFIQEGMGFPVKAEMYYNENMIIICPKKNSLFSSLFNFNLPIIITANKSRIEKLTNHHNVYLPDNLRFSKWNDLMINFHDWMFKKIKYEITIQFLNKSEIDKLPAFKMSPLI